jgi:hypothetical protein
MQMRMIVQLTRPGVQHRRKRKATAQPLGVFSQAQQRLRGGRKQQIVHLAIVAPTYRPQLLGHREDHVKVRDRKQSLSPLL